MSEASPPSQELRGQRKGSGRNVYTFADQIVSNASNALLPILVAGTSSTVEFGLFAIAWIMSNFIVRMSRNALGVHLSLVAATPERLIKDTSLSLTAALVLSPFSSTIIILGGFAGTGAIGGVVLALAVISPVVITQDLLRFSGIALGRGVLVLTSDAIWLAFSMTAVAWRILGSPEGLQIVLVWGIGALLALIVLGRGLKQRPLRIGILSWARDTALRRLHLTAAAFFEGVAGPVVVVLVGAIAGPDVVAALSGSAQLMAPVNTAISFLTIGLLPRAMLLDVEHKVAVFRRAALTIATLALAWAAMLSVMPARIGRTLLGSTWTVAEPLIGVVGVQYAIGTFAISATILLTSMDKTRSVLRVAIGVSSCRIVAAAVVSLSVATALGMVLAESLVLLGAAIVSIGIALRSHRNSSS